MTHALGLFLSIPLTLLIPAPLINLCLGQICLQADLVEGLFGPMGLQIECAGKLVQLLIRFTLSLMHDFLDLSRSLVKEMVAAFGSLNGGIHLEQWFLSLAFLFEKCWQIIISISIDISQLTVFVSLQS